MLNPAEISIARMLQQIAILNQSEITFISSKIVSKQMKKGDFFITCGMHVNEVAYLVSGRLRKFIEDREGKQVIQQIVFEKQFFTDLDGYVMQKLSGTNIQAITRCYILIITITDLELIQKTFPHLNTAIQQISDQTFYRRIKMDEILKLGDATEQYISLINNYPQFKKQVPLKDVASILSITPSSLSRLRKTIV